MKKIKAFTETNRLHRLAMGLALSLALGCSAQAQNVTHLLTGAATNNWSTATWTNGVPNLAGDLVSYNTATGTLALDTLTLDTNVTIGVIKNLNTGALTIVQGASNVLTLDATGLTAGTNPFGLSNAAIAVSNGGALTVNAPISLTTSADMGTTGSGNLAIGGAITATNNVSLNLRSNNTGTTTISGNIGQSGSNIDVSNLGTSSGLVTLSGNLGSSVTSVTQKLHFLQFGAQWQQYLLRWHHHHCGHALGQNNGAAANTLLALGTGTINLNGGTLSLAANPTANGQNIVTGNGVTGNNLTVGGNATLSFDRATGSTTTSQNYQFNNLSIGANTLTLTGTNTSTGQIVGTTTLTGNATFLSGRGQQRRFDTLRSGG